MCFVSFDYPPFLIGGPGVYAKCLCTELAKLGNEIHVLAPHTYGQLFSIEKDVFVHRIPFLSRPFLSFPTYELNLRKHYKLLEKDFGGFDVLHSNHISDFSLTKRLVKAPRIVTLHHLVRTTIETVKPSILERIRSLRSETGLLMSFFEDRVINRASKIIAVSQFARKTIVSEFKISPSKVAVIPNGIYPDEWQLPTNQSFKEKVKEKLGFTRENEPMILFVGRLEPRKGIQSLFKAFRVLLRRMQAKLVIRAGGELKTYKHLASSMGISKHIIFLGFCNHGTLKELYNVCDVFVLPSLLEGFGIVLLEAMAAGKPIVATNVGGIPEVIEDGENGILVKSQNPAELAEALLVFLKNKDLAEKVGNNNRRYVKEKFSWKKNAELTQQVYEDFY